MQLENYIFQLPSDRSHFWNVIQLQFTRCVLLWDGFVFPTGSSNLTLAGFDGDIATLHYPGFNGYHVLEPEYYPADLPGGSETAYFVWCGRLVDMVDQFGPRQGAKLTMKMLPSNMDDYLDLIASERLVSLFLPVTDTIIQGLSGDVHRVFMMQFLSDRLLTKQQYILKQFVIVQAFTSATWLAILVSLLFMGIVTTVVLRTSELIRRLSGQVGQSILDWCRDFFTITNQFYALLLGRPADMAGPRPVRYRYLSIYAVFGLTSVFLSAMLTGSLINLMIDASDLLYMPQALPELCTNPDFSAYKLFAFDTVDLESDNNPEVMHCLRALDEQDRFVIFPIMSCITGGIDCLTKALNWIYQKADHLAMMIGERDMLSGLFLAKLAAAQSRVDDTSLMTLINEVHLADGGREVSAYLPLSAWVPDEMRRVWQSGAATFRENGCFLAALDLGDERIKERFIHKEPPPRCQIIALTDLLGCFGMYGLMNVMVICSLLVEGFVYRKLTAHLRVGPTVAEPKNQEEERTCVPALVDQG